MGSPPLDRWPRVAAVLLAMSCGPQTPPATPPERLEPPPQTEVAPHDRAPTFTKVADFVAAVHGMAVAADDTLFFADTFKQLAASPAIYRLAPPYDGAPDPTGITGATPAGLEFVDGDLFVCDVGAGTVTRYDPELSVRQSWAVAAPWNLVSTPAGEWMAVTHGNELVELKPDGSIVARVSSLLAPFDLALGPENTVWISEQGVAQGDPGRLARWDEQSTIAVEVDYEWANPEGLAVDRTGALWVAETEQHALLRVSADGSVEHMHDVDGLPVVIATLGSGDLLVSVTGPSPHLLRVDLAP